MGQPHHDAQAPPYGRRVPRVLRGLHRPSLLPEGRRLPDEVWQQRHRWLTALLWAHVPAFYVFALFRGFTTLGAAAEVAVLLIPPAVAMVPQLSRNVRSASTSIGLVISASVLVQLSGGSIEAHFHFFVILAFLTLYQVWLPFLLALLYVVVEHAIVGAIIPRDIYNNVANVQHPLKYALIHGGFVLLASSANILAWRLTEQEALHDGLTRLPNRANLLAALSKALEGRGRSSTAVLFIDLDNFKDANDAFGHQVGDALLQALSHRLLAGMRGGDVLARLGGDEFAVMLTDVPDRAGVSSAADRILIAFQEPVRIGDMTLASSASIGYARVGDDTTSATDLLRKADLAMYEAKRRGGGRVAEFKALLHTAALRRTELEAELRVALDRNEFVLHYQPIVDVRSVEMISTEALIRWQHPTRGLLGPMEFITAAEQAGLIVALGAWVIRTACAQTVQWQRRYPDRRPITVAVNLSPRQLVDRTLVATVAQALLDNGMDPATLCLEITEGSVIKDLDATLPTLHELRALGVSLALDDFGTGYSSLSYLQQLPVNSVKVDRSFVSDLEADGPNAKIVLATIDLAHALGLSVTAEGVETPAQLAALQRMGSERAQGYLLSRPVAGAALTELLDRGEPLAVPPIVRPRLPVGARPATTAIAT